MNRKAFFKSLDAPLRNTQWSWGAERERDHTLFLCVWNDEIRTDGDRRIVPVLRPVGAQRHGHHERERHIELVRNGAPCFLVFLTAKDPDERPRRFKGFDSQNVVRAGDLVQRGDEVWIEVGDAIPVERVMRIT